MKKRDTLSNEFKKNVYLKPDEYLNGWARKCGWKASLVYDSLWRHADKERCSFPSIKLMAEEHGVSGDTIMRGLKMLIKYNLVKKEPKRGKSGRFLHNTYTLTNKNKWQDPAKSPTATRSTRSLTATHQVAHSDYKDTHIKDTHIIPSKVLRKKTYGNERVSLIIKEFERRWGYPPTDHYPRKEAWNLVRRIEGFIKSYGKEPHLSNFKNATKLLFDGIWSEDWVENVQGLSTIRRKTPIYLKNKEAKK